MNAFQQALLATIKSIAPPATSVSQQAASASTPMSSVNLSPSSMTDTGSQLTAGPESDMDMQHSDLGVDIGDGAGNGAAELQPVPQPENRTSAVITETMKSKKPAPQKAVPKLKKDKSDHTSLPKKRMRISEGEAATSAAAEAAQPETTQREELIRLEPETPPYSTSLRGTPLRESARAAKLLITKSKSKSNTKKRKPFQKKKFRKDEEKKTAESSTTVSSFGESEKGFNLDQLLKKEKAKKKKKHQRKTKTSMSTSATSVASTSSKSKPKKSSSLSKTTEVETEPVVISEEEQEAEGTLPEGQEEDFPETVAVTGRKRKGKPIPFKTADMKGKVLNLWMDLQQCARAFLIPGTPKIVGR